jgi:competence protein ComFB
MAVHNAMEDVVLDLVGQTCDELEKTQEGRFCTAAGCRHDLACFVLNRVHQQYVSSARGVARSDRLLNEDNQLKVDIVTLIHEGIRRISQVQRSYYSAPPASARPVGPVFNFPAVKGRILLATTFEPLTAGEVFLLRDGKAVDMIDPRWQNPFAMSSHIAGVFLFLPQPVPAGKTGMKMNCELEISLIQARYEELHHYFTLELVSEGETDLDSRNARDFRLPELFAAPLL